MCGDAGGSRALQGYGVDVLLIIVGRARQGRLGHASRLVLGETARPRNTSAANPCLPNVRCVNRVMTRFCQSQAADLENQINPYDWPGLDPAPPSRLSSTPTGRLGKLAAAQLCPRRNHVRNIDFLFVRINATLLQFSLSSGAAAANESRTWAKRRKANGGPDARFLSSGSSVSFRPPTHASGERRTKSWPRAWAFPAGKRT